MYVQMRVKLTYVKKRPYVDAHLAHIAPCKGHTSSQWTPSKLYWLQLCSNPQQVRHAFHNLLLYPLSVWSSTWSSCFFLHQSLYNVVMCWKRQSTFEPSKSTCTRHSAELMKSFATPMCTTCHMSTLKNLAFPCSPVSVIKFCVQGLSSSHGSGRTSS